MNFLKRLRRLDQDPSKGIAYNSISLNTKVSSYIYSIDIARTPMLVTNNLEFIDIQKKCRKVNLKNCLINLNAKSIRGREF